jgi:WD40 repeat protein
MGRGQRVLTASTDGLIRVWDSQVQPTFLARSREAVRLHPRDPLAHYELGRARLRTDDPSGAVESFMDALRLDPKLDQCHERLMYIVNVTRPVDEMEKLVDKLSAAYPTVLKYSSSSAILKINTANQSFKLGKQSEAIAQYRKGLAVLKKIAANFPAEPDHLGKLAQGHRDLASLLGGLKNQADAMAEYGKARQILEDLVAEYPAEGKFRADLASTRFMMGDPGGTWSEQVRASDAVHRIAFSPDGSVFVASGLINNNAGNLRIYNARGEFLRELHANFITGPTVAGFSPDGSKVIGWNHVWEVATGTSLFTLEGTAPTHAEFTPDGKRIVSSGRDGTLGIWDASSGTRLHFLEGHDGLCTGYCSPNNRWIVSYGQDKTVRCWDAASAISGLELWKQSGQSAISFRGPLDVCGNCFSEDGSRVLSRADDGSVCVWESATGKAIARLSSPARVFGAVFVKGGSQVAAWGLDKKLRVWDLPSGKPANEIELGSDLVPFLDQVSINPDGRMLLTANFDRKAGTQVVKLRDLATGKTVQQYEIVQKTTVKGLTFSPDSRLAAAGGNWMFVWRLPKLDPGGAPAASVPPIVEWRTEKGAVEIRRFHGHTDFVHNVTLSPDGKTAVSVGADRTGIIWDVETGKLRHRLSGSPDTLYAAAITPDGKLAMTGGQDIVSKAVQKDFKLRVWDTQTGNMLHALAGHTATVSRMSAAKKGLIVSSSWDQAILQWNPTDGGEPERLFKLEMAACALAIDANGERFAVGSPVGSVAILGKGDKAPLTWHPCLAGAVENLVWLSDSLLGVAGHCKDPVLLDLTTKTNVKLVGHIRDAQGIDAAPGGKYVVTGSDDGTVRVWRAADGIAVSRFNAGCGMIRAVRVLPDGLHVLCTGGDGTLRLWRLSVPKEVPQH